MIEVTIEMRKALCDWDMQDDDEIIKRLIELHEQSKWVKFDEYDGATYPEKDREVMLDVGYGLITGWLCIEENPFSHTPDDHYNTLWVCLDGRYEINEISSVTRWQYLPEFKE